MLKFLGTLLVLLGTSGMGYIKGKDLILEKKELQELRIIFLLLRSEIEYKKSTLSEAFYHIGKKTKGVYKMWLEVLSEELEMKDKKSFHTIWSRVIDEQLGCTHLKKNEILQLKEVGEQLHHVDTQLELSSIDLYVKQLTMNIEELQKEIPEKRRIYSCLGIMAGIFITIILI